MTRINFSLLDTSTASSLHFRSNSRLRLTCRVRPFLTDELSVMEPYFFIFIISWEFVALMR